MSDRVTAVVGCVWRGEDLVALGLMLQGPLLADSVPLCQREGGGMRGGPRPPYCVGYYYTEIKTGTRQRCVVPETNPTAT